MGKLSVNACQSYPNSYTMAGKLPKKTHHMPNDRFLSELTLMFHESRNSGEVKLVMKRYDGRMKPYPKDRRLPNGKIIEAKPIREPDEYCCLIRAEDRKKKISTYVTAVDALKFQLQFSQYLRSAMDGLKKDKKVKPKKTQKAKKATH